MAKYQVTTDGGTYEIETDEAPQPQQGFFSSLGNSLKAQGSKLLTNITDPHLPTGDALKQWVKDSGDLLDKAKASANEKDYGGAAAHGLNFLLNAVPGLGKAMDDATTKITQADELYDKDPQAAHDMANSALGDLTGTIAPLRYGPTAAKLAGKAVVGTARAAAAVPGVMHAVAASPELGGIARDALGVVSPRAAHAVAATGRVIRLAGKIGDALSGPDAATAAPEAAAGAPQAAPATPAAPASAAIPSLDEIARELGAKNFKGLGQAAQETVQKYRDNFVAEQARKSAQVSVPPPTPEVSPAPATVTGAGEATRKPPEPAAATVEPPGAASQEVDALLKKLQGKMADKGMIGHPDEYKIGNLKTTGELQRFGPSSKEGPVIDSSQRKSYSTAEVANPTMISNKLAALTMQNAVDELAKNPTSGGYEELLKKYPELGKANKATEDAMIAAAKSKARAPKAQRASQ